MGWWAQGSLGGRDSRKFPVLPGHLSVLPKGALPGPFIHTNVSIKYILDISPQPMFRERMTAHTIYPQPPTHTHLANHTVAPSSLHRHHKVRREKVVKGLLGRPRVHKIVVTMTVRASLVVLHESSVVRDEGNTG